MYNPATTPFLPQNVDATTRMLIGLKLKGQLGSYVSQHKDDPNLVSLATFVNNMDDAATAMKHAGPQPTVVDQEIAKMTPHPAPQPMGQAPQMPQQMPPQAQAPQQQLPEESGIGQLPAQNLQGMGHANGGIVGYASGGEIPRFNGTTGSVPSASMFDIFNMNPKDARAYADMLKEQRAAAANAPTTPPITANASGFFSELARNARRGLRSLPAVDLASNLFFTSPQEIATLKQAEALKNNVASIPQSSISGTASAADVENAVGLPTAQPSANTPPGPGGQPPAGAQPPANPNQLPPSLLGNAGQGIRTGPPAGLPSVASFADQLMGINQFLPQKEATPNEETFMSKRQEASAPVWSKFQSTIDKEKDRLDKGKEQDFYMALIEGGLEAAAGNSPNGLQNLAAGFSKGAKSYSAALKDFRKAAQENSKMELDMERARAAEKRGDMDAFQKAEDSVKNRNADIDKLKTSGIFALQNVHTSGAYQLESTRQHVAGQLGAADLAGRYSVMAHGMPTGVERMVNQMPGENFADKLKSYSSIMGVDARGDAALLQKYAGKEGEMALKIMEAGSPQERAQAQMIRAKLQNALLTPLNAPAGGGPIRP
jgi:hypothetical protein